MNQQEHAEPATFENNASNDNAVGSTQPVAPNAAPGAVSCAEFSSDDTGGGDFEQVAETIDIDEAKRALEAALLAASEPMALNELRRLFDGQLNVDTVRNLLEALKSEWEGRSVELVVVASGYRFRVKPVYQKYLDKLSNDKPLKYSRAVLETLAIIAYRQPVTRGDIEDIRGVAVSPHILKTLEDRGWIDEIGNRETVGRPALFATTKHFLDDLNLRTLEELPPLHELQATLDMSQFGVSAPPSAPTGTLSLGLDAIESAVGDLVVTPTIESVDSIVPLETAGEPVFPVSDEGHAK